MPRRCRWRRFCSGADGRGRGGAARSAVRGTAVCCGISAAQPANAAVPRWRTHRACVQCGELSEKRSDRGGLCRRCGKAAGNRRAALQIRRECGVLSAEDERRETAFLTRSDAALAARSDAEAFDAVRLLAESAGTAAEQNRKNTLCALENSLRFVCCGLRRRAGAVDPAARSAGLRRGGIPAKRKQLRLSGAAVPRNAGSKGRGVAREELSRGAGL